jgi:hypothetical protein
MTVAVSVSGDLTITSTRSRASCSPVVARICPSGASRVCRQGTAHLLPRCQRVTGHHDPLAAQRCPWADRAQFVVRCLVVATFSSVTRQHILQAIAEYDARGGEEFLEVYGFGPSRSYTLVHEGRSYDAKAILGVAHRFATGRLATSDELDAGSRAAVAIMRKRGFEVSEPTSASHATPVRALRTTRPTATRSTVARSAVARSTAARETPAAICPTCSMTLPATGICDECG